MVTIAVDAMGGDHFPKPEVEGSIRAAKTHGVRVILVGDEGVVRRAFVGAVIGSFVFGFLINGLTVPGQSDTNLLSAVEAIPGAVIGMAVVWFIGVRQEQAQPAM